MSATRRLIEKAVDQMEECLEGMEKWMKVLQDLPSTLQTLAACAEKDERRMLLLFQRSEWLRREIKRHRALYLAGAPEISDAEYDALTDELRNYQERWSA